MADEITVTMSFVAQKGSAYARSVIGYSGYSVTMTGTAISSDTPTLATTVEQTIDFSSASAGAAVLGMFWIKNNSTLTYDAVTPNNYVDISYGTGAGFAASTFDRLAPGEARCYRAMADLVYVKAVTSGSHTISVIGVEK